MRTGRSKERARSNRCGSSPWARRAACVTGLATMLGLGLGCGGPDEELESERETSGVKAAPCVSTDRVVRTPLLLRVSPAVTGRVLATLPASQRGTALEEVLRGGIRWTHLRTLVGGSEKVGWSRSAGLACASQPPPAPLPAGPACLRRPPLSKIGFHVGPNNNDQFDPNARFGLGDWMRALDGACIPFYLKSADSYGQINDGVALKRKSGVPHELVFRFSNRGDYEYDVPLYTLPPRDAARLHWERTKAILPPEFVAGDHKRDVWLEVINEVDKSHATPQNDWLAEFAVHLAEQSLAEGYRVAMFGWSSGEPEPSSWTTPWMRRFLALCAANPEKLAVSLHEYSYNSDTLFADWGSLLGRFLKLFAACDAMGIARPTVHITEFGWGAGDSPAATVSLPQLVEAAGRYAPYPQLRGAALWTLGWGGYKNLSQVMKPLTEATLAQ
ncbi:MAG: hypothetical protein IT371_09550 [Deltaproteobacteria bacterium]|nr:hypothetical protein [Deltaproteobacteria bacterium]